MLQDLQRCVAAVMLLLVLHQSPISSAAPVDPNARTHVASHVSPAIGYKVQPGLVITTSPQTVSGYGETVTVAWTGLQFGTDSDWIGLFCPAGTTPFLSAPVKYQMITIDPNWQSGNGTMKFFVPNLRQSCQFFLMTGGAQYPMVVGESNVLTMAMPTLPTGIHLALTGSSSEMRVSWTSAPVANPIVTFSCASCVPAFISASASTYTKDMMSDLPAMGHGWLDPGMLYTAIITGLKPGLTYEYTVGGVGDITVASNFTSPTVKDEYKFIAFGDMGQTGQDGALQHSWDNGNKGEISSLNTTRRISEQVESTAPPDLVLHIGDISYAVGYEAEWDNFMTQIEPVSARIPWMTSIGNHEMGCPNSYYAGGDSGGECGVPYTKRFLMPAPADQGTPDSPWYSFTYGFAKVIMISTEHDYTATSGQHAWVVNELTNINRTETPFVIFTGHRPMYVDSTWDTGFSSDQVVAAALREAFEPLLMSAKVDLALWGHHHSYQRTHPVYNNATNPDGTTHVVIGMAGYELSYLPPTAPEIFAFTWNKAWGFSTITMTKQNLTFSFIDDQDGSVKDTFTLASKF